MYELYGNTATAAAAASAANKEENDDDIRSRTARHRCFNDEHDF